MVLNPSQTFPELTILHEARRNISIKTEVRAKNESKAKDLGSQLCIAECQIFAFCSDALLILDSAFGFRVIEKASNKAGVSMGCITVIMNSSALTTKQLESALFTTIKALKDSDDLDYLNRAIHWRSLGKMEFGSKIDRFIKFWIALEVLVDNEDGNDVQKVKNALKKVYPELKEKIQQDGIVGSKIFALREEIFHEGKLVVYASY